MRQLLKQCEPPLVTSQRWSEGNRSGDAVCEREDETLASVRQGKWPRQNAGGQWEGPGTGKPVKHCRARAAKLRRVFVETIQLLNRFWQPHSGAWQQGFSSLRDLKPACEQLTSTVAQSQDTSTRSSVLQAPLQGNQETNVLFFQFLCTYLWLRSSELKGLGWNNVVQVWQNSKV